MRKRLLPLLLGALLLLAALGGCTLSQLAGGASAVTEAANNALQLLDEQALDVESDGALDENASESDGGLVLLEGDDVPAFTPLPTVPPTAAPAATAVPALDENSFYTTKSDVALYLHLYGHLPGNFITKSKALKLGWEGGGLDRFLYGGCIGGDRFGNYEGLLPEARERVYYECDIDTLHKSKRGAKRIVFSNDGLIYYTDDHYASYTLLYGEE